MEIKLLKKCVDSFCPLILSEFGVCLKVMMIDQIDYMLFGKRLILKDEQLSYL